ncbi:hypothetical protein EVAR_47807_1 [Eumeta japonica]|uniref:Uncharacterized protein n=1 Tax=Eumeta variegata TaxID=151549 RepID=A0A4C1Z9P1_EUMVA|nr:hypothetical protein EVAR_47807_1 [Eumeta japonica]
MAQYNARNSAVLNCLRMMQCADSVLPDLSFSPRVPISHYCGAFVTNFTAAESHTSKPLEEWEKFWTDVRDILLKCYRNERIIILRDFSGYVGVQRDAYKKFLSKFGDERVNENEPIYLKSGAGESEVRKRLEVAVKSYGAPPG